MMHRGIEKKYRALIHMKNYLQKALAEAQKAEGQCAPNPAVGAVVVKNNEIIATGFHHGAGHPHAEVEALSQLSQDQSQGATLYVTLEPCCHHGRTPPCTDLIIARGIKQVVYAFADLNPVVANKSEMILNTAGIASEQKTLPDINAFYQAYAHWWKTKTPWMIAKLAISADHNIAGPGGQPIHFTGEAASHLTHRWRARSDAILTTVRTIINDDPQLNARLPDKTLKKPLYVLDRQLTLPLKAKVFETTESITLFHGPNADAKQKAALTAKGIRCFEVPEKNNLLNMKAIVKALGEIGLHRVWIEAGGQCFSNFYKQGLLQQAILYRSPKILGDEAKPAFAELALDDLTWMPLGQDEMSIRDF